MVFLANEILEVLHYVFRNPVLFHIDNQKGKKRKRAQVLQEEAEGGGVV